MIQAIALARLNGWWDAEERAAMICSAVHNAMRIVAATVARSELDDSDFTSWKDFMREFIYGEQQEEEDLPMTREQGIAFFRKMGGFD